MEFRKTEYYVLIALQHNLLVYYSLTSYVVFFSPFLVIAFISWADALHLAELINLKCYHI